MRPGRFSGTQFGVAASLRTRREAESFYADLVGRPRRLATIAQTDTGIVQAEQDGATGLPSGSRVRRVWTWPRARMHYESPSSMEAKVREVGTLGFTDAVLHVNSMDNGRESTFAFLDDVPPSTVIGRFTTAAEHLRAVDADVHLMLFPAPHRAFMEGAVDAVVPIVRRIRPRSVLLDAEGNWRRPGDHAAAVEVVRTRLLPALNEAGCTLGFTDFMLDSRGELLARECHYVLPQAYSTTSSGAREPGVMQRRLHGTFARLRKPTGIALAAWHLRRPASNPRADAYETMAFTLAAVEALTSPTVSELAYWSLPAANAEPLAERRKIHAFFQDVCRRARHEHAFASRARFV